MKNKIFIKSMTHLPKSKKNKLDRNEREHLKLDLLDEYDYPSPFPKDQFDQLNITSDQAYFMFSTAETGR